jgi:threonine synthase
VSASRLRCVGCGLRLEPAALAASCPFCGAELTVDYEPGRPLLAGGPGIFRFGGRLPVRAPERAVSLGEGDTPLVDLDPAALGLAGVGRLRVKCEFLNPTGSFKDRVAAVAATLLAERSLRAVAGTSSGNGGAAMAAYAARAGRPFLVFALSDTVPQKLSQIRAAGGRVVLLEGLGHEAAATETAATMITRTAIASGILPFITAARFAPEAMEGAKTIAYELAAQAPRATAVYVPIGGGGLFSAIGRGYREIAADLPGPTPRLVAVQPSGCATITGLLGGHGDRLARPVTTGISGLQVSVLFDARQVAGTIAWSGGHHVEVDDADVRARQARLARGQGILVEPAGAAALAAVAADLRDGALGPDDDVVVLATGAGYKDGQALSDIAAGAEPVRAASGPVQEAITRMFGELLSQAGA